MFLSGYSCVSVQIIEPIRDYLFRIVNTSLRFVLVSAFYIMFIEVGTAHNIPSSYEEAKSIGEVKLEALLKSNAPEEIHYVVLKKDRELSSLLIYENAVYVIEGQYDLKGRTIYLPKNSVLVFRNGIISNGTLIGNGSKYCINNEGSIRCQLAGRWEKIAPVFSASELGFKKDAKGSGDYNNARLLNAINKGVNIFLDGNYYFSFSKPIVLNYQLHLFGGKFSFSRHAFDLTMGGGLYANGVHFSSIDGTSTDDIVCGTRDKHPAITTSALTFLNCHFSCNRVISLEFDYTNPKRNQFGISSLCVSNCYADCTGKFFVLDAVFKNGVHIQNNIWKGFSTVPIYLTCNHSKRINPQDVSANPWSEEIIAASSDFVIDSNVFIGKEVTDCVYYCSALVKANKCFFTNNYIKDIISYSDKNHTSSSTCDAYLSCVDVIYKNNYVEDVMSYSKDGATKPQCEIGKSKTNPLEAWKIDASRVYTDNIFVVDGNRYLAYGADPRSIYISIFNNSSEITQYFWERNAVLLRNISLWGRNSSAKYGAFSFKDNILECESFNGSLIFPNSAFNQSRISITGNDFSIKNGGGFILFNQLYNEKHRNFKHQSIIITDNSFTHVVPLMHYFTADTVRVQRNRVIDASLNGMAYMNNYSGSKLEAPVSVLDMISDLPMGGQGTSKVGVRQVFSSSSSGIYSITLNSVPAKGVEYAYVVDGNHSFKITYSQDNRSEFIDFSVKKGFVTYSYRGGKSPVVFGTTKPIIWYTPEGLVVKTTFVKGAPNRIVTSMTGNVSTGISFEYRGK